MSANEILMTEQQDGTYTSSCGLVMKREDGQRPNGSNLCYAWVIRDRDGAYIGDRDYRADMEAPFNLKLVHRY